jgi:Mg2+ and Co2+ transporter CorA
MWRLSFAPKPPLRYRGQSLVTQSIALSSLPITRSKLMAVSQRSFAALSSSSFFRDLAIHPLPSPNSGQGPVSYPVAEINSDGTTAQHSVTKTSLLTDSKIHARDFISLLSGKSRRTRPDVLVRDTSIVICFSHIRAIIRHDRMLLFDPEDQVVRSVLPILAKNIAEKPALPHPFDYLEGSVDFELRALESILSLVCETYRKRATLIAPLVDGVIRSLSSSKTPLPNALHQLLPMKDHLSNFEIETGMARDVLTTLLKNDEDLLGLLLSEKRRRHGETPPLEAHRTVELMLENYCSQMTDISQEAYYLRKRIESVQSIVELTLDSHRNRLLHLSLQLNMGTIAIAWMTAAAGFFGMNLHSGIEETPGAFWAVIAGSSAGAGVLFIWLNTWFSRLSPNVDVKHGDFDTVFQHLDEIQSIFENSNGDRVYFSKEEFRSAMRSLKVSEEIADLVWHSFELDVHHQNALNKTKSSRELRRLFDLSFLRRVGIKQTPVAFLPKAGQPAEASPSPLDPLKKRT